MHRLVFTVIASVLSVTAIAEESSARMSRDELLAFLPGTRVAHVSESGSQRRWANEADGTLIASTDNKKFGSAMGNQGGTARGTWKVNDDGKYCVEIDWRKISEKWCSFVLKAADGAYYLNTADSGHRIEFAR